MLQHPVGEGNLYIEGDEHPAYIPRFVARHLPRRHARR